MPDIQCLPRHVADLIAAGEVVERPASVAKELLENALDAGATAIVAEVQHGGLTYLRMTDNGCGIAPEELSAVVLTHLDADHTSGLRSVKNAQRILLPEEEGWWTIRTVYKLRQPESMYRGVPIEHFWFKGTMDGPLWWSYDLFGDDTIKFVCLPGHTDGQIGVKIKNGKKFVVLTSDAAFTERSWREKILPGYGFNEKAMLKSFDWIEEQANDPDCVAVIANHDPDVYPQIIEL